MKSELIPLVLDNHLEISFYSFYTVFFIATSNKKYKYHTLKTDAPGPGSVRNK